eukprot:TRINITY_DN6199_c0_g1_i5.p1 TRINITY_DN6199_c0_g1~~TRINITY_DN6199_c0_g1_i5.p1  ORF type:complete len:142 (+),score=29.59 TRINITY_DN6199_c0_g1_i5:91-516(+)
MARRLAFSFAISVIPYSNPGMLYSVLVFIIQVSIWMQHQRNPYRSQFVNHMELASLYVIFFSFFLALLAYFLDGDIWISTTIVVINGITVFIFLIQAVFAPLYLLLKQQKQINSTSNIELNAIVTQEPVRQVTPRSTTDIE